MQTHAERFRHLLEVWGLTQEELGNLCGIKRGTVGTIVNGKTTPDGEALATLLRNRPDLNPDWLLLGNGPMLRDGKALAPAPKPEAPAMQVVGEDSEVIRLKEANRQQADMIAFLKQQLAWAQSLVAGDGGLGKLLDGNYAAEPNTRPIGFQTAATVTLLDAARMFQVDDRLYFAADDQSLPVRVVVTPVAVQESDVEAA